VPELLLQPTLAGLDQAGVAEIVVTLLKQMPLDLRQVVVQGGLLLTGGNSAFGGEQGNEGAHSSQSACRHDVSQLLVVVCYYFLHTHTMRA
jgi:hypothetical protein